MDYLKTNFIGTEVLIDRLLTRLGHADDELKEWPADTVFNEKIRKRLSYSKMISKMNDRHIRTKNHDVTPV